MKTVKIPCLHTTLPVSKRLTKSANAGDWSLDTFRDADKARQACHRAAVQAMQSVYGRLYRDVDGSYSNKK